MNALVGRTARNQSVINPEKTRSFSIKRFMGRKFDDRRSAAQRCTQVRAVQSCEGIKRRHVRVVLGDKEYSPPEVSAMILAKDQSRCRGLPGRDQSLKAVITVPAYFNDSPAQCHQRRRQALPVWKCCVSSTSRLLLLWLMASIRRSQ